MRTICGRSRNDDLLLLPQTVEDSDEEALVCFCIVPVLKNVLFNRYDKDLENYTLEAGSNVKVN